MANNDQVLKWRFDVSTFRLIGRDLITDRVTALFELIKNCYDANATEVTVSFENVGSENKESVIVIKDNGFGMSFDDITECDEFTRLPNEEECNRARDNLKKYGNNVDYVITYDVGFKFRSMLKMESNCFNNLHAYLNEVASEIRFKRWYFGCFHIDRAYTPSYYGVYKNIYELESGKEFK